MCDAFAERFPMNIHASGPAIGAKMTIRVHTSACSDDSNLAARERERSARSRAALARPRPTSTKPRHTRPESVGLQTQTCAEPNGILRCIREIDLLVSYCRCATLFRDAGG